MSTRKCTGDERAMLQALRAWPNGYDAIQGTSTFTLLLSLNAKGYAKVVRMHDNLQGSAWWTFKHYLNR